MSNLREYLVQKRERLLAKRAAAAEKAPDPLQIAATVRAEGRSGIRRIRIRDYQIITDSATDFAGYGLGPTAPELQLGVLGSCLAHSFLIQAADRQTPIDALEVAVAAEIDARAGHARGGVDVGAREQVAEVLVAEVVTAEDDDGAGAAELRVLAVAVDEVQLGAEDGLHLALLGGLPELDGAEEVVVVGHRDGAGAIFGGARDQVRDPDGRVQHAELRVRVEVDEAHRRGSCSVRWRPGWGGRCLSLALARRLGAGGRERARAGGARAVDGSPSGVHPDRPLCESTPPKSARST